MLKIGRFQDILDKDNLAYEHNLTLVHIPQNETQYQCTGKTPKENLNPKTKDMRFIGSPSHPSTPTPNKTLPRN